MNRNKSSLTVQQVLKWADLHHRRTGAWPTERAGRVVGARGETWMRIANAFRHGSRGLGDGSSLARLLADRRGKPYLARFVRGRKLTRQMIREWAQAHYRRTGVWPTARSGKVQDVEVESWGGINSALYQGLRGLPRGSSLAEFLGRGRHTRSPKLTIRQILRWADSHRRRTGKWPGVESGRVFDAPERTWRSIRMALRNGYCGLPNGSSIKILLTQYRGVQYPRLLKSRLTIKQILAWADDYHRRTGRWPGKDIKTPVGADGLTWHAIDQALMLGNRGLSGHMSLADLLLERRGRRHRDRLSNLSPKQILAWADEYHRRIGRWPNRNSGPIPQAPTPGETWEIVNFALLRRRRGLRQKSSLAGLLVERRGARFRGRQPKLMERTILLWARAYARRHGQWPTVYSGPVDDAPGESWRAVNRALGRGGRGLLGGSSLARLIAGRRVPRRLSELITRYRPRRIP